MAKSTYPAPPPTPKVAAATVAPPKTASYPTAAPPKVTPQRALAKLVGSAVGNPIGPRARPLARRDTLERPPLKGPPAPALKGGKLK